MNVKYKKVVSFLLALLIMIPMLSVNAQAANGVQTKIDDIRSLYPDKEKFFSFNHSECQHGTYDTCTNCALSWIDPKAKEVCGEGNTCYAFAKYVFYHIFGISPYDEKNPSYTSLDKASTGDYVICKNNNGTHSAIFLELNGSTVYFYESNMGETNKVYYHKEHSINDWTSYKIYHARNYDEINGSSSSKASAVSLPVTATPKTIQLSIDTGNVGVGTNTVDVSTYNIGGNNFIKLRALAALLKDTIKQFGLSWDDKAKAITLLPQQVYAADGSELNVSSNFDEKEATASTATVYLNGQRVDIKAYNIDGYNYFKLVDVAAAIDFEVSYDDATKIIGINSSASYNSKVEPVIPSLLSPQAGISMKVGETKTLSWSDTGASRYKIELINDTDTEVYTESVTGENYNFTPEIAGSWRWQVRSYLSNGNVGGASLARKITVTAEEYNPPNKPNPLSPSNGSEHRGSSPTLSWSAVNSPSSGQVLYYAETFDCPNPENSGWRTDRLWTPSSTSTGLYNWRVKSIDVDTGKESGYGTVRQYSIVAEYNPPNKPNPLSPSNGSEYKGSSPTLSWSAVSSPSNGQVLYYAETFDCPNLENSGWRTDRLWTPSSTSTGLYNWHVKSIDVDTGKESGYGTVRQYSIVAEYQPPDKPNLLSPDDGSTYQSGAPTLFWSAMSSPSGGEVKYYVETFDCPNPQNSGWITGTSWTPVTNNLGTYNWHVKSIDISTGKESGWGSVWQFYLEKNSNSTDLHLDIRVAKFGPYDSQNNYSDQTSKVREQISNDSVTISASDSFFFQAGDPGPSFSKTLIVIYRNRWNEEWQVSCNEGQSITLTRDSREGTFLLDADS